MGTQKQWEEMPSRMVIFLNNFNSGHGLDLIQFSCYIYGVGTQKQWEEMPSTMVMYIHNFIPAQGWN